MKICSYIEKVLTQDLKMELVGDQYIGSFKEENTDEIVTFRCYESDDDWGIKRLLFECDESVTAPEPKYTLDQMLEACYRDYKPLGNKKVVQYILEISSMYDDEKQNNAIEMFLNDNLQKAYQGIKVVSFNRTTSWVSEEYYK